MTPVRKPFTGVSFSVTKNTVISETTLRTGFYAAFFFGTRAPFLRASERPIAMACFLLFTLPPLPPRPERKVPFFLRRIALATVFPAPLLYLRRLDFFFAGMLHLLIFR